MRTGDQIAHGGTARRLQPPPYPAGETASHGSEPAGQPRVSTGPGTRARDYTPPLEVRGPQVRRGRGARAQSHVAGINHAVDPVKALRESVHTLTSVITQASRRDPATGAAWAWTAIHLIDGLNTLIEHGIEPHPWFRQSANWRLNPAGWAPPAALAKVAARLAGGKRNGEDQ